MATSLVSPPGSAEPFRAGATPRQIILLGLPGAGKSTAGALAAERLGWTFIDLDAAIEREAGMSVTEIFAREGEAGFRAREVKCTRSIAVGQVGRSVIAPGGGWVEDPANLRLFGAGAVSVYLRVSPLVALGRLGESAASRPLIAGARTAEQLNQILRRRETSYLQANHTVDVDSMTPAEVADSIVALASGFPAD